ncbi:MAG: hypothetical protein A2710_24995 [Burkholderiales bacterium RIFCSPHIGHO2_01_FULL_64_960]|nr:MAG: hypothetical protein A2710_24995 [Burkholderiales bacterium RIFCSPHIGHO2_01_FULL_64_960]
MRHVTLTFAPEAVHQWAPRALPPLRATLALGCAALALAGCGGGSGSAEPGQPPVTSTLPAPENFENSGALSFAWSATPGATRYELFADMDGPGPQTEAQMGAAQGLSFYSTTQRQFGHLNLARIPDFINATFRLRACNSDGCGAFTAAKALDLPSRISYEFSSGRAPLKSSSSNFDPISQDGLTLVLRSYNGSTSTLLVFARTAAGQPWQQQAEIPTSAYWIALSADGNTLAASEESKVQIYQRSSGTWSQPTTIASTQTPAACPQPCQIVPDRLALSANGNLLAVTGRFGAATNDSNAVFTYVRTGTTWAAQSHFAPGDSIVGTALALSGDGSTLALNSGAITRGVNFTPPHVHIYAQNGVDGWTEQARLPVGIVNFLDIAASRYSAMTLSHDGNTLAVEARNAPNALPAEYHITAADLTCASPGTGSTAPGWHIALFARDGAAWQRQAVIARETAASWALANNGNALFYGELFNRRNGVWACP